MKTKLCMVVLLAMALSGCVGPAAREKTLLPAIGSQWQLLRADAAGDVTGMDRAVEAPACRGPGRRLSRWLWRESPPRSKAVRSPHCLQTANAKGFA
jgi:hypothetical protein